MGNRQAPKHDRSSSFESLSVRQSKRPRDCSFLGGGIESRVSSNDSCAADLDALEQDGDVEMIGEPGKLFLHNTIFMESNGGSHSRSTEICFGALYNVKAIFHQSFQLDKSCFPKSSDGVQRFPVIPRDNYYVLQHLHGKSFAILDICATSALDYIRGLGSLRFQAVTQGATRNQRTELDVSINIYGSPWNYELVGSKLLERKHFLQHPDMVDAGIDYDNPQYLRDTNIASDMNSFVGPRRPLGLSKEVVSLELEQIMDSLDSVRWNHDIPSTNILVTPLLSHQKIGVRFIRQRECLQNNTILRAQKGESGVYQLMPELYSQDHSLPSLGGIIADVMGLGKTLTMVSAIVLSLDEAKQFRTLPKHTTDRDLGLCATQATLVVVPSAQLMEVWISEIDRHVVSNCLKVSIFHGSTRAIRPHEFADSDLVLTTYSTLMSDHQRSRVLHRLKWFRLVLDEAHWIRNDSTKQFRAVNSLHAERRWCLTGTPIQNRLEDLGSLVQFLKIEPFDGKSSKASFQKYVIETLFSPHDDPCQNIRLLLRSICLRRTSQPDSNIKVHHHRVELALSVKEKSLYNDILQRTRRAMDEMVSNQSINQRYTQLFTSILHLRMLCNHGTYNIQGGHSITEMMASLEKRRDVSATNGDSDCDVCQSEESFDLLGDQSICPSCSRFLRPISEGPGTPDSSQEYRRSMPPSLQSFRPAYRVSPLGSFSDARSSRGRSTPDEYPEEFSTKLSAVVENLKKRLDTSKSIVFSNWKKTLNILGRLLHVENIRFARVDGDVSYSDRAKQLADFQNSLDVRVLLMTYGTGAVGLNLPVANCIHITEPQWNPAMEEQAIGRALRLGQTRDVTVIRYVLEHTVEQAILDFQEKKKKLAKFTFDSGKEDSMPEKLEELKFVLYAS